MRLSRFQDRTSCVTGVSEFIRLAAAAFKIASLMLPALRSGKDWQGLSLKKAFEAKTPFLLLPPSSPPQIAPAELKCQLGPRPPAYRRKALAFISGRFELLPEQALAPLRGSQEVKHGGVCACGSWPGQVRSATVSCVQTRRHPTTSKSAAPEHQQRRRLHTWKPFHIPSVLPLVIPDPTQGRDLLTKQNMFLIKVKFYRHFPILKK